MEVTIKDVAKYCGVSVSTVSRCLNGYTDISPETTKRVFDAIKILDFVPSNTARQMTKKHSGIIGLTIPDVKDSFFSESASGAEAFFNDNGYQIFYGNMNRSAERFQRFLQLAREMRFDGLIITPDSWDEETLKYIRRMKIPIVSIRRRPPQSLGIPYVDNDHYKGAIKMMSYLADLGHEKIAHIILPTEIGSLRKEAYLDFCDIRKMEKRAVGCEGLANKLSEAREYGYSAMKRILKAYPDTTAVFAGTDELAIGAMICLKEIGLSVPKDISVCGINNVDYASLPWFDLTSMSLNRVEMGRIAAQMLLGMINGKDSFPESVLIDSDLIVRGSTTKNTKILLKEKEK